MKFKSSLAKLDRFDIKYGAGEGIRTLATRRVTGSRVQRITALPPLIEPIDGLGNGSTPGLIQFQIQKRFLAL